MQRLSIEQIKEMYPNEWVLIGNPDLGDPKKLGSIVRKLISGIVLDHSKDKKELADRAYPLTKTMDRVTCIYTGELPTNRRYWLFLCRNELRINFKKSAITLLS